MNIEEADRKRAFYLGMAFKKFVQRKAELLKQAKMLKEAELNERSESIEIASA